MADHPWPHAAKRSVRASQLALHISWIKSNQTADGDDEMDFAKYKYLKFDRDGRILTIMLNRPEALNSIIPASC
jgi:hypothetical protein